MGQGNQRARMHVCDTTATSLVDALTRTGVHSGDDDVVALSLPFSVPPAQATGRGGAGAVQLPGIPSGFDRGGSDPWDSAYDGQT